jgi:hypothetical protein
MSTADAPAPDPASPPSSPAWTPRLDAIAELLAQADAVDDAYPHQVVPGSARPDALAALRALGATDDEIAAAERGPR